MTWVSSLGWWIAAFCPWHHSSKIHREQTLARWSSARTGQASDFVLCSWRGNNTTSERDRGQDYLTSYFVQLQLWLLQQQSTVWAWINNALSYFYFFLRFCIFLCTLARSEGDQWIVCFQQNRLKEIVNWKLTKWSEETFRQVEGRRFLAALSSSLSWGGSERSVCSGSVMDLCLEFI